MIPAFATLLRQSKKDAASRSINLEDLLVEDVAASEAEKDAAKAVKKIMLELENEFEENDKLDA